MNASDTNGKAASASPSLRIVSHFIQDLSFENPTAGNVFFDENEKPELKLRVNVRTGAVPDGELRVATLYIKAEAVRDDKKDFIFELAYTGFFIVTDFPEEAREYILNVEAPKFLFPFARRLTADVIREGGYPAPYPDPIDFERLYIEKNVQENAHKEKETEAATN